MRAPFWGRLGAVPDIAVAMSACPHSGRMDSTDTLTRTQWQRMKALDCIRAISAMMETRKTSEGAARIFERRWPRSPHVELIRRHSSVVHKAAIPGATTTDPTWAAPLLPTDLTTALLAYSQPFAVLPRIGARVMPLATRVVSSTVPMSAAWAGGGKPKALAAGSLDSMIIRAATATIIIVVSDELARLETPESEEWLLTELSMNVATFTDDQFFDSSNAGTDDNPAAITNGVTPAATSSGDAVEDLRVLLAAYVAAGGSMSTCTLLISSQTAAALILRAGAGGGSPIVNGLTVSGGTLAGCPCVASDSVGAQLVAIDRSKLAIADGGADIRVSRVAALEMLDTPSNNAATPTATTLVSLWQNNCAALRVERFINWHMAGAVAVVDGVNYLAEGGSPA